MKDAAANQKKSLRAIEWLNFFLADVQTGLGPFVAAYLASNGWQPSAVGYALTFGGVVTVAMQTPAGAAIDAARRKRVVLGVSLSVLVSGAVLLMGHLTSFSVYCAEFLIGASGPFLAPTLAAITLGVVGAKAFDTQFGKNQAFNSAGNVFTALLIAFVSYKLGYRYIFAVSAALAVPAAISLFAIDGGQIDYSRARGLADETSAQKRNKSQPEGLSSLLKDRVLLFFLIAVFLFHLANAAMLPQLGEMLSKDNLKKAAPFMSACVIVTQLVIALTAAWVGKRATTGRRPLLLLGFGVLPVRGVLYTIAHAAGPLIAIQVLDGVANAIFVIVSILVVKDRTEGTGRFNLAAGALATMVGVGAALSMTLGGVLIQHFGYSASFFGLAGIALLAFAVLWFGVPETLADGAGDLQAVLQHEGVVLAE